MLLWLRSVLPARGEADAARTDASQVLVRTADVQLNITLARRTTPWRWPPACSRSTSDGAGRPTSVRALLLVALAARVARLRGVTRRYISHADELLPLTSNRRNRSEALSYLGYYWSGGHSKRARLPDQEHGRLDQHRLSLPLSWSVGQLSMCAALQGRLRECSRPS
ncbi:MAG: hypothetical protein QM756_01545 [Polyangiaceae bacterium]